MKTYLGMAAVVVAALGLAACNADPEPPAIPFAADHRYFAEGSGQWHPGVLRRPREGREREAAVAGGSGEDHARKYRGTCRRKEFDQIYGRLSAGPIPDGPYYGDLFFRKGENLRSRLGEALGGVAGRIADAKIATLESVGRQLWKGKMFYRNELVLRNLIDDLAPLTPLIDNLGTVRTTTVRRQGWLGSILPNNKVWLLFPAKLYCGQSLVDSRRESVIIDYSYSDEIEGYRPSPDSLGGRGGLRIRDEISMVRPGFYLGRAYANRLFLLNFTLYSPDAAAAGADFIQFRPADCRRLLARRTGAPRKPLKRPIGHGGQIRYSRAAVSCRIARLFAIAAGGRWRCERCDRASRSRSRAFRSENCCRSSSGPRRTSRRFRVTIGPITSSRQAWTKVPSPESLTLTFGQCRQRASCRRARAASPSATCPPACRHARARRSCPGNAFAQAAAPSAIWLAKIWISNSSPCSASMARPRRHAASFITSGRGAKRYCGFSCQCSCCRMPRVAGSLASRAISVPAVGIGEIGMGDIGVRPAGRVGDRLHPLRLVVALARRPVGLDVDRLDDVAAGDVAAVFLDRIVAADRLVRPEDARHLRPRQPRQVVEPPDVMMGVDGRNGFHCSARLTALSPDRAWHLPKISAAMRLVSIAAGTPQYIATSSSTSCTCALRATIRQRALGMDAEFGRLVAGRGDAEHDQAADVDPRDRRAPRRRHRHRR